jgi:hypothetical protein
MFINGVAFLLAISLTLPDWLSYSRLRLVLITRFFLFRYFNEETKNDISWLGTTAFTVSGSQALFVALIASHLSSGTNTEPS